MKTIIISEEKGRALIGYAAENMLNESYSDKVLIVKKFLDDNFIRSSRERESDDGTITKSGVVVLKDSEGQPSEKTLTDIQLFYLLQNKFKKILPKGNGRDDFLKQVAKDWFNNKISKYGSLSSY